MTPTAPPVPALLLRIVLDDFKPAIYREVLVDPSTTLRKLHTVIQAAMGWDNAHLYAFALPEGAAKNFWRIPNNRKWQRPDPDTWDDPPGDDAKVKVGQLLAAPKDRLLYMYDFGDDWQHTITLKALVTTEGALPHLLKAQNACPPEDCGGPPGAQNWSEAWYDTAHEDHEMAREMFGDQEPGTLDFEGLQKAVAKLKKTPRTGTGR